MSSRKASVSISQHVLARIASGELTAGDRLGTQALADDLRVSRTPVRDALRDLVDQKVLEQQPRRGFFVIGGAHVRAQKLLKGSVRRAASKDPYLLLVEDWLTDAIPADVTESQVMERYRLSRGELMDILMRAVREGWAERKEGYGWRFLDVAKTPEAFEQVYRFRAVIEPAALLEPTFNPDHEVITRLKTAQERLLDSDLDALPAEVLLSSGSDFHEALAEMSGNPFFHTALVRANRMRRLMEYRTDLDRQRVLVQCRDHLTILQLIEEGNLAEASYAMRRHLSGALEQKSPVDWQVDS